VLRAMDTNVKSKELIYYGGRCLAVLSSNEELRSSLSEGDGISLIVDSLHAHKRDKDVALVLLVVLVNLVFQNSDSKKAFADSNGIPITCSIISSNHNHSDLLQVCLHLLRHVSADKLTRNAEAKGRTQIFKEIIAALNLHTQNEPLVTHALWIFLNLMNGSHDNKEKFLSEHGLAILDSITREQERNEDIATLVATVVQQILKLQRVRTDLYAKGVVSMLGRNLTDFIESKPLIATYKALHTFALHTSARSTIGKELYEPILAHIRLPHLPPRLYAIIGKLILRLCLDDANKAIFVEHHAIEAVRVAIEHTKDHQGALRFFICADLFLQSPAGSSMPMRPSVAEVLLLQHISTDSKPPVHGNPAENEAFERLLMSPKRRKALEDEEQDEDEDEEDEDAHSDNSSSNGSNSDSDSENGEEKASNESSDEDDYISAQLRDESPPDTTITTTTTTIPTTIANEAEAEAETETASTPSTTEMASTSTPTAAHVPDNTNTSSVAPPSTDQTSPRHHQEKDVLSGKEHIHEEEEEKEEVATPVPSIHVEVAKDSPLDLSLADDPEMDALLKDIEISTSPAPSPRKPAASAPTATTISAPAASGTPTSKSHHRRTSRGSPLHVQSLDDSLQDLESELEKLKTEDFGSRILDDLENDLDIVADSNNESEDLLSLASDPDAVLARIEAIEREADGLDAIAPSSTSFTTATILAHHSSPSSSSSESVSQDVVNESGSIKSNHVSDAMDKASLLAEVDEITRMIENDMLPPPSSSISNDTTQSDHPIEVFHVSDEVDVITKEIEHNLGIRQAPADSDSSAIVATSDSSVPIDPSHASMLSPTANVVEVGMTESEPEQAPPALPPAPSNPTLLPSTTTHPIDAAHVTDSETPIELSSQDHPQSSLVTPLEDSAIPSTAEPEPNGAEPHSDSQHPSPQDSLSSTSTIGAAAAATSDATTTTTATTTTATDTTDTSVASSAAPESVEAARQQQGAASSPEPQPSVPTLPAQSHSIIAPTQIHTADLGKIVSNGVQAAAESASSKPAVVHRATPTTRKPTQQSTPPQRHTQPTSLRATVPVAVAGAILVVLFAVAAHLYM